MLVPPPVLCCSPTLAGQRSPFYCGVLLVSTSCLLSGSVWIIQEAFDLPEEYGKGRIEYLETNTFSLSSWNLIAEAVPDAV